MKKQYKSIALACCLAISCNTFTVWAQSGDEQGLEVPGNTQLPQDKEAIIKAGKGWWKESRKNYDARMAWYNEAKFGCFIHWGVYSVPAGIWKGKKLGGYTEHLMRKGRIPLEQYKKELVAPFNPTEFNAEEWMRHASEAGMNYFIITAKHHDGFAMYPSDAYPYDMRLTKYGKDPMEALRKAARKYGIKFGFYYSHAFDWEHPDAPGNDWDYDNPGGDKLLGGANWWTGERKSFLPNAEKYVEEKSIPQIQELIKKYDPDILWFDTPSKLPLYLNIRILEAIREADPQNKIVVNGRLVRFGSQNMGDYRNTGDRAAFFFPTKGVWESIPTTNESYGYSVVDTVRKSVPFFVQLLASAASKGGNILMNVGPMGNGKWDARDVEVFQGIGKWLKVNGESIYGTQRTNLPVQPWGVTTLKGDTLYAHVYRWPSDGKLVIGGLRSEIKKGWCLANKKTSVKFNRLNADDYELALPAKAPDSMDAVIALILDKQQAPNPIRLLDARQSNILYTFDAQLQGRGLGFGDGKPNRNYVKNWKNENQSMKWKLRLNEPAEYTVYLDYNTAGKNDTGTVIIEIAGQKFEVNYPAFYERNGSSSVLVGKVKLDKGALECNLKGKQHTGNQYMNPIAVRLEK
ncbi:alpha-L-fucosidase [Bacteroides congonensis]|uniref:alpha-L-fucosidase n=1 Tax=Bacteroides congonensis TaxID=1871006 RepID=UPI0018A01949|nr:alpha-L-fucosidase [Bacteroides congonensis]